MRYNLKIAIFTAKYTENVSANLRIIVYWHHLFSINDLYSIIRYLLGYLFRDYIKKSTRKGIKNVIENCK